MRLSPSKNQAISTLTFPSKHHTMLFATSKLRSLDSPRRHDLLHGYLHDRNHLNDAWI